MSIFTCYVGSVLAEPSHTDDVRRTCEPILINAVTKERSIIEHKDIELWTLNKLCDLSQQNAEESEARGFNLETKIKNKPLKLLLSKDKKIRKETYNLLCKEDFSSVKDKSILEIHSIDPNPDAFREYNQCVITMSEKQLFCSFNSDSGIDTFTLAFRKTFNYEDSKIKRAVLTGGLVEGSKKFKKHVGALNNEKKLEKVVDGGLDGIGIRGANIETDEIIPPKIKLVPGTQFFTVFRTRANSGLVATINLENGLSCEARSDPLTTVKLSATIRPLGQNIVASNKECRLHATKSPNDCSSKPGSGIFDCCVDPGAKLETSEVIINHSSSPKDNSTIDKKEATEECLKLNYTLRGAGWDGLGFCKGSPLLDATVKIAQKRPSGAVTALTEKLEEREFKNFCTATFRYSEDIQPNVLVTGWQYNVTIEYKNERGEQMQSSLSNGSPNQEGFISELIDTKSQTPMLIVSRNSSYCNNADANSGAGADKRLFEVLRETKFEIEKKIPAWIEYK